MLKITCRQNVIRSIIDILTVIVEEAKLDFEEDKLVANLVDPSHVALIKMEIDASAFEAWEVDPTSLSLNLSDLNDMVKLADSGDLIDISYDEAIGDVGIEIEMISRTMRPLEDRVIEEPKLPEIDFPTTVTLLGNELAKGLKAAGQVGDLVTLTVDSQKFGISASGETDKVEVNWEAGQLVGLDCDSPVRSQFSLNYLLELAKRIEGTDSVSLYCGENYPLKGSFNFAEGAGEVIYFLAPRVEGDMN